MVEILRTGRFVKALRFQAFLLVLVLAARVSLEALPELIRSNTMINRGLVVATILIVTWAVQRSITVLANTKTVSTSLTPGMKNILLKVLRLVVFALMFLIVVDSLGISITPILASLGVGSVAVALALQDTLGNVFSGLYILIDRPLAIGDTIRLDSGVEGTVIQIGWRSTHLQLGSADILVIPNSKLASSTLTNFSLPKPETAITVEVAVSYHSDLEQVEKIARETADAVMRSNPGGAPNYQSVARFHTFGDTGIGFTVVMHAKSFADRALLRHEFIKALKARFEQDHVDFPLRQREIHWAGDRPKIE